MKKLITIIITIAVASNDMVSIALCVERIAYKARNTQYSIRNTPNSLRPMSSKVADAVLYMRLLSVEDTHGLYGEDQRKIVNSGQPYEFTLHCLLYHGGYGLNKIILDGGLPADISGIFFTRVPHKDATFPFLLSEGKNDPAIFVIRTDLFNRLCHEFVIQRETSTGILFRQRKATISLYPRMEPYPRINVSIPLEWVEEIWIDEAYKRIVNNPQTDKEQILRPKLLQLLKGKIKVIPGYHRLTPKGMYDAESRVGKYMMSRGLFELMPKYSLVQTSKPSTIAEAIAFSALRPMASIKQLGIMSAEDEVIVKLLIENNNIFEIRKTLSCMEKGRKEHLIGIAIDQIAEMIKNIKDEIPKSKILIGRTPITRINANFVDAELECAGIMVKRWNLLLRALFLIGVLDNDIIYPFSGVDFFPAVYGNLIQIDRSFRKTRGMQRFFMASVAELLGMPKDQIAEMDEKISANAIAMDARRIKALGKALALSKGPRTVMLKGTDYILPLKKRGYFSESRKVAKFLSGLDQKIIREGDYVVLFGSDAVLRNYFINLGYYKEIPLNKNINEALARHGNDFFNVWVSKKHTGISFYMPSQVVILRKRLPAPKKELLTFFFTFASSALRPMASKMFLLHGLYEVNANVLKQSSHFLAPRPGIRWEEKGTSDPAIFRVRGNDNTIYIIYNAKGDDDISRLGLAIAYIDTDGKLDTKNITRFPEPIIDASADFDKKGCERPRATIVKSSKVFDDELIITYSAILHKELWRVLMDLDSVYYNDSYQNPAAWVEELGLIINRIKLRRSKRFQELARIYKVINKKKISPQEKRLRLKALYENAPLLYCPTNEPFTRAAIARMPLMNFIHYVKEWQEGRIDSNFNNKWRRSLLDSSYDGEREENLGAVLFPKRGTDGYFTMLDTPLRTIQGMARHAIRIRKAQFIKGPWETIGYIEPECNWEQWMETGTNSVLVPGIGWVILYCAGKTKTGMLIFDEADPAKLLYRSPHPVMKSGGSVSDNFPTGLMLLSEGNADECRLLQRFLLTYGLGGKFSATATFEIELTDVHKALIARERQKMLEELKNTLRLREETENTIIDKAIERVIDGTLTYEKRQKVLWYIVEGYISQKKLRFIMSSMHEPAMRQRVLDRHFMIARFILYEAKQRLKRQSLTNDDKKLLKYIERKIKKIDKSARRVATGSRATASAFAECA